MLAAALGLIVIFASLALFEAMDRAKKIQTSRLESNFEMATAHRVIQQALRSLLMSEDKNIRDDDQKDRIAKTLQNAVDHPYERDSDTSKARFSIQPDMGAVTADGRPAQSLELTLVTPPIHAASMLSDADKQEYEELRSLMMERRRQLHLFDDTTSSKSGSSEGKDGSSSSASSSSLSSSSSSKSSADADADAQRAAARSDRLRAAASGLTGHDSDPVGLDKAASREMEAPRAPGLRGVFELRPEDDPKVLARLRDSGGSDAANGALALWWRQIPVDDGLAGDVDANGNPITDPQLLDMARRSRADSPQIKLLTGLKEAHWQVYLRRKMLPKMSATTAKELPAYVEFKFETVSGRREDWLFEVAWSYGPDPGTIIAANDVLNGAPGALAPGQLPPDLQNLINQAIAQGTPNGAGANGSGTGTGSTASGDPSKGQTVGSTTGTGSQSGGRPVAGTGGTGGGSSGGIPGGGANGATQAEIDAILRQFGLHR
jgi:hypothetical protein